MVALTVQLFGRFDASVGGQQVLNARAPRELLGYLVLHRDHPQRRETLAALLWEDASPTQGRKYLRQALWQLQTALKPLAGTGGAELLEVDPEWVQLNSGTQLTADVAQFEGAMHSCHGVPGAHLDETARGHLAQAVSLYRGGLLEGWYQDWCALERERFQHDYASTLEKLVCACAARHEWEQGLAFARRMLTLDPADEQAYRHTMCLHARSGNRTQALREFQRCERVLMQELGIAPSAQTRTLYESIRSGRADTLRFETAIRPGAVPFAQLPELSDLLLHAQTLFADIDARLRQEANAAEQPRAEP